MDFTCHETLPGPSAGWWVYVHDVHALAPHIPGLSLDRQKDANTYEGALLLAFGPTRATFHGSGRFEYDDDARTMTIVAQGADQRGATSARITLAVTFARGDDSTTVVVEGEYDVIGPLAAFAKAGGREVLIALTETFLQNLRASSTASQDDPMGPTGDALAEPARSRAAVSATATEIRVGQLLLGIGRTKFADAMQVVRARLITIYHRLRRGARQ